MMLSTFITVLSLWGLSLRAADDIFAQVYTNSSAQVGGGMSLERAQSELKRYRALRRSLGLSDTGLPARFGAYTKPMVGMLAGGALAGGLAMLMAELIKADARRDARYAAMDERFQRAQMGGQPWGMAMQPPESKSDFDKINSSQKEQMINQIVPGTIAVGALGGYGTYRLIDFIADKIRQRRAHNRALALIARWPAYRSEAPAGMKKIMARLHKDLARSGIGSMPSPRAYRISKLLGQTIAYHEAQLRSQIAAHKKAAKQRKGAR